MDKNYLSEELKTIVMKISKAKQKVSEDTNMVYDLGFDSVAMIELFTEVEERYGIEFDFDDVDFDDIVIYGNFLNYVACIIE